MSKLGKINITVPEKVNVSFNNGIVDIKGPIGSKQINIDPNKFTLEVKEKNISIKPKEINDTNKRFWGLNRSLINNAVIGVDKGFEKTLELVGVGYRAKAQGQKLDLAVGFSHNIVMDLAQEIKVETITEKGQNPVIKLTSFDKQLVGQVAAKIRSFRKPEPYKGKGIRFVGEHIRRKAGKSA